ncbi:methyl-accepting chemotaxis sensory transducer with Pas/Pac sensor [Psychromonas sp. CNPT3]|uniref:methyl-accepting chemotaxis protein n=1 Tax=Psychromonas sp. CNPT3 TaxID=314282 RepID=UPI00006E76D1|nr:HAMP domain-containing methyl-accepting chemotaxis protein [Psychromonas sp. CNPT3]AGH81635.1 methyl-accepting chemotaxis sensory transducer with Pas/Pac sensor [Psychromonas sp. CNPT3]
MKLSISQLIYAGFSVLILTMISMSLYVNQSSKDILTTTSVIKDDDVPSVILYLQLLDEIGDMQSNALEYLTGEAEEVSEFDDNYKEFTDYLKELIPLESSNSEDREKMALIHSTVAGYSEQVHQQIFNKYDPDKERWAFALVKELEETTGHELETLLDKLKVEEFNDALRSTDLQESLNDDLPGLRYYLELIDESGDMLASINGYIQGDKSKIEAFNKDAASFLFYFNKLKPLEQKPQERLNLKKIEKLYHHIMKSADAVFTGYDPEGKVLALLAIDRLEHEVFSQVEKILDQSALEEKKDATDALEETYFNISTLVQMLQIATPISVIFGMLIAFIIARTIEHRLVRIKLVLEVADKIGAGDLTSPEILDNNNDEVSKLATAINKMSLSLNSILSNVRDVADSVNHSAVDVENISSESSLKIIEQKDKSIMLAESIQEMSVTADDVARQSASAFARSQESSSLADKGGEIVKETAKEITELANSINSASESVNKLGQQSNEIGEIITVITSIAEQTNLLALNAAIEAARAGEAGRGFAVVADEVRNLAAKTTQATQQVSNSVGAIQQVTKDVVEQMALGTDQASRSVVQAKQAGESLNLIVEELNQLNNMIESIASTAEQQSATVKVMAKDVTDITNSSTETATISAAVTDKSIEMKSFAGKLSKIVKGFKL